MIDVCDIQVMKPLLESYGFHFSKAKGQNFLTAAWVPEAIAREAGVDGGSGVLEIGPGIGSLTQQLCLREGLRCGAGPAAGAHSPENCGRIFQSGTHLG